MLLDEPLCNLDANLREEMRFEIKMLQRNLGVTNFVSVAVKNGKAVLDDGLEVAWTRNGVLPPPDDSRWNVGFRPSDVKVLPPGQGIPATIRRASFLGAMTEYRIDLGGQEIRTEVETLHMLMAGSMYKDANPCGLAFLDLQWFPAREGEVA